jgi:hypothetical protein
MLQLNHNFLYNQNTTITTTTYLIEMNINFKRVNDKSQKDTFIMFEDMLKIADNNIM